MKIAEAKNIRALLFILKKNGYVIYEKPYQLNIVGVRSDTTDANKFDDLLYAFWKDDKGKWQGKYYTVTTDPGTFWLKNPSTKLGTAILAQGQYVDSWQIGLHKGKYEALTQAKPVKVIRDYDRNAILDFNNGKTYIGIYGINIHHAGTDSKSVDNWSAGCQVFSNLSDFNDFMELVRKSYKLYGNKFTYTLIDERAYLRAAKKHLVYFLGAALLIGAFWTLSRTINNKSILPKF